MKFPKQVCAAAIAAACIMFSPAASAVPFSITAASYSPGNGYEATDLSDSLLAVAFRTAGTFTAQTFELTLGNPFATFNFGTVSLLESTIVAAETDGLGVTASFTFTDPLQGLRTITATGNAFTGPVVDNLADYTLQWLPVTVLFDNGGAFEIRLNTLSFTGADSQVQTATITLLREPAVILPPTSVPEPASVALMGLSLAGLAFTRRKSSGTRPS